MRFWILSQVVGGLAVVAISFFGTLFAIDHFAPDFNGPRVRDGIRAKHAAVLRNALDGYHKVHGVYPTLPDNLVDDLKKYLVDEGYLPRIPNDPLRPSTGRQYRYVSDGAIYGILFNLESSPEISQPGGQFCLVGTSGHGFWGNPPLCTF